MKTQRERMLGAKNPRWNGGISMYPDHAKFKRQRAIVLQQAKGQCELCGRLAVEVHHIDENKANHALDNLLAVCKICHGQLHTSYVSTQAATIRKTTRDRLKQYCKVQTPRVFMGVIADEAIKQYLDAHEAKK